MRFLNKIASVFCASALGMMALTSCEGSDLFSVDAPDWISQKADSIANAKNAGEGEEVLEGMEEDVYTIGKADFTSGWWSSFSKYYVIPDGKKWNAVFNLNINPGDNTYYKNFALVITSDDDRGGANYAEYGAFRYDFTNDSTAYNSQWGDYLFFKFSDSSLPFSPVDNKDANLQKLNGRTVLTVDRSQGDKFLIKISNGSVTKTYTQPYPLRSLPAGSENTNIRCFLVPEGSYIDFLQSNIEPIGGYTSAEDKAPVSMVLEGVPGEVNVGASLEEAMANVTAQVTFENVPDPKTVTASDLTFQAIPDMANPGEKTLVAVYNKTFKGANAAKPVIAYAKFNAVLEIVSIEVTEQPLHTTYYYYTSVATEGLDRNLAFDPTGLKVTATYVDGNKAVLNNANLAYSAIPAQAGTYDVTITTSNGKKAVVKGIKVAASAAKKVTPSPKTLGAEDNTSGWWSVHTDNIKVPAGETRQVDFTNYSSLGGNWNNFVIVLRNAANAEYAVVRADNYGWGNGYAACLTSGGQDWATWLAAMNGAKVTAYITNCNNGTADVQVVMKGTDGNTYIQYYLGINTVDADDLCFAFTVDSSHYVFD